MEMPFSLRFARLAGICKMHRLDAMRLARKDFASRAGYVELARSWNRLMLTDLKTAREMHADEVSRG